ncbi:MAG: 1,4-beta-xylanase [Candidatus Lokiarchaeota archaeon]|nr:1,4-beta-xylanase [Candidatus Lokiarchaeota archaeon]
MGKKSFQKIASTIRSHKKIFLAILIVFIITGSLISFLLINRYVVPADYDVSLSEPIYTSSNIPIGVAVEPYKLKSSENYKTLATTHFNSFTPENVMKMGPIHPQEGEYNWEDADFLVEYAENNSMQIHGHCLVWHEQLPDWMENYDGTSQDWKNMLKLHIQTVVNRYKDNITSWDVVNEAFLSHDYRDTIWYEHIGADYIKYAFQWAHEADPDASLYYNDFSLCTNIPKLDFTVEKLGELIGEGVPIHGLGFQAHLTSQSFKYDIIVDAINKVNQLGIDIRVSELDISMNLLGCYQKYTDYICKKQQEFYSDVVRAFSKADSLTGITLWGIHDAGSWIRYFRGLDWPLLFDEEFNPKPCALSFQEALIQYT